MSNQGDLANTVGSVAVEAQAELDAILQLPPSVQRALKFAPFNYSATQFLAMMRALEANRFPPAIVEEALLRGLERTAHLHMIEPIEATLASTYAVLGVSPLKETQHAKSPRRAFGNLVRQGKRTSRKPRR